MASRPQRAHPDSGPEAARRFEDTMRRVLSVPKEELAKREAAYQKNKPHKRGTKTRRH